MVLISDAGPIVVFSGALLVSVLAGVFFGRWFSKRKARLSAREFDVLADMVSSAIFVFNDRSVLYLNHSAETLTGWFLRELSTKTFSDFLHPDDRQLAGEFLYRESGDSAAPHHFECRVVTRSGETRWVDVTAANVVFNSHVSILATAFDITEKKRVEEALRESELRYRIITELMFDYAYLDRFEDDGTMSIIWITESATRLTGYTAEEWKRPEMMASFIHSDDIPNLLKGIQEVMKGNTYEIEGRVITRDGRTLWMYNYAAPIWNADHTRVTHMYGIARNITERKEAELRLAVSEERYRSVAETAPDAIVIVDEAGVIQYVNHAADSIFGYEAGALVGTPVGRIIPDFPIPGGRHDDDRKWNSVQVNGVHRDGPGIPLEISVGEYSQEKHRFTTGIIRNISERMKAETKLRSLALELSGAEDRERKRMASYLHDVISQGLALARMKVRLLQRSPSGTAIDGELAEIQKLLDQSITDTRTLTFELYPVVLYEHSFEAAVAWLGEKMESQHGITYTLEDDGLPKPLSVEVRNTLFQSTRECLVNIIKHAQASTVHITITRSNSRLCLEIADNGKGIEAGRLPALMSEGGFGLYSIRERLTGMGGTFEISTEEGKGMRVRMSAGLSE